MTTLVRLAALAAVAAAAAVAFAAHAVSQTQGLSPPETFASIADTEARSAAMFTELAKVLTHPRCMNCHPSGDRPRQTDQRRLHQPPVFRGADGHGLEAMRCAICHGEGNFDAARMPGHPAWHLAPREMGWEGKTLPEICAQLKDPVRNGRRDGAALVEHIGSDTLVGWAWHPGYGREPGPGTQAIAGALVEAWFATGAGCPK